MNSPIQHAAQTSAAGRDMLEPVGLEPGKVWKMDKQLWLEHARYLEEYCRLPIDKIRADYYQKINGEEFSKQKEIDVSPTPENIRHYYENCTTYLYELSFIDGTMEMQREHRKVVRFFKKERLNKVLEFGGGVGGFSSFLQRAGLGITYFDVVGHTSRYAAWRFRKLNLNIPMVYDFNALEQSSFDAIHSSDCLEHVSDLPSVFRSFNRVLRAGGFLVFKATFHGGGIHLRENERFHDVNVLVSTLENEGLIFKGQLKDDRLTFNMNKLYPCYWIVDVYVQYRIKHSGNYLVFQKVTSR